MKFTVVWLPSAEQELASIWAASQSRSAVAIAANAVDALLSINPQHVGESRSGNARILIIPPLVVTFSVKESDRVAQVEVVRLMPQAGRS